MKRAHLSQHEREQADEVTYREDVQQDVDNAAESRRAASGFSPEQVKIVDAANDGRRAGAWGFSPSLNPFPTTDPRHDAWEKARMQAASLRANGNALRRLPR